MDLLKIELDAEASADIRRLAVSLGLTPMDLLNTAIAEYIDKRAIHENSNGTGQSSSGSASEEDAAAVRAAAKRAMVN